MRSPRLQLLSLFLTAAVIVLGAATIMHVHGVSDPHAHHTPADFMLQFQTLLAVLLPWIAFPSGSSTLPPRHRGVLRPSLLSQASRPA
jgi:hypothetical protein